jgi:dTDP-4-dehydrorhamnose reductase
MIDSPPPLPMLVTGLAGVPGYNAFHYFRSLYGEQVIGIRQSSMWPLKGDGIVACDVEDELAIANLWREYQFASLLNCAGCCKLKSCELNQELAHRVNVLGTENLVKQARRSQVPIIHLSVDLVFSGIHPSRAGGYIETDPTDPVTVYGAKMAEAEQVVLRLCPDACILRISLPMGISFSGHAGAIDWISSRFKQDKPATLFFDEYRTPHYTDCLNRLFVKLFSRPLAGIYHAGGPRELCLFQIAQVINVVGGYDPQLVKGCNIADAGPMPPRAGNVTMDTSKLTDALGENPFDPWPLYDHLVPTDVQWHLNPNLFAGSPDEVARLLYKNPNAPGLVPPNRNELWGTERFSGSSH